MQISGLKTRFGTDSPRAIIPMMRALMMLVARVQKERYKQFEEAEADRKKRNQDRSSNPWFDLNAKSVERRAQDHERRRG